MILKNIKQMEMKKHSHNKITVFMKTPCMCKDNRCFCCFSFGYSPGTFGSALIWHMLLLLLLVFPLDLPDSLWYKEHMLFFCFSFGYSWRLASKRPCIFWKIKTTLHVFEITNYKTTLLVVKLEPLGIDGCRAFIVVRLFCHWPRRQHKVYPVLGRILRCLDLF